MEYITEEQFDFMGMNIMSVLDGHLKLITRKRLGLKSRYNWRPKVLHDR